VVAVQVGGVETCNCKTRNPDYRDTHITLVANPNATAKTQSVIVEVTPRLRLQMASRGVDWSTDTLGRTLSGKWVTVKGWLLRDDAHINEAENTAPGHPADWRATAWEIHPIMSITLLPRPPVPTPRPAITGRPGTAVT